MPWLCAHEKESGIAGDRGKGYLSSAKNQAELRKIKREISALKKTLRGLETRKAELESQVKKV